MDIAQIANDIKYYKANKDSAEFDRYNNINKLILSKTMQSYKNEINQERLYDYFAGNLFNNLTNNLDKDEEEGLFISNHIKELREYDAREIIKPHIEIAKEKVRNYLTKLINEHSINAVHKINVDVVRNHLRQIYYTGICNSYLYSISINEGIEMEKEMIESIKTIIDKKMVTVGVLYRNLAEDRSWNGDVEPIKLLLNNNCDSYKKFNIKKMMSNGETNGN